MKRILGFWLTALIGLSTTGSIRAAESGGRHFSVQDIHPTNTRDIHAAYHWLWFPVKNRAEKRGVTITCGGKVVQYFEIELADAQPDWWAPLDISRWKGETLTVSIHPLPETSRGLEQITQSDKNSGVDDLYRERLRPQFHFSAKRGWLNDPNGLAYFDGEYHLFFQHSPFSWGDSAKWWGHAVSRDLVHWEEIGEALAPDDLGAIWSGSGVVDHGNTSGLGKDGHPPLVLIYTAAGDPFVQCIASSADGRTFTKYPGNPVVKNITGGNRDPRVFWYEPSKHWVMVLWVEENGHNTIHFLTSPNLKEWTPASVTDGGPGGDHFLFECPDMFELPVNGDPKQKKWVLTAANGRYALGTFDGQKFTAETSPLPGPYGGGSFDSSSVYAPQTFSDDPKGRRIQMGWFQTTTPDMPFNQSMSLPLELRLVTTPLGPRRTWTPVKELESLRAKSHIQGAFALKEGAPNPLAAIRSELIELRAEFQPNNAQEITFSVRGVPVVYEPKTHEIVVNGHRAPAPLHDGTLRVTIFADRTGLEVFAADGLVYIPTAINLDPADQSLAVSVKGGTAQFRHLDVYELRSAWKTPAAEAK